MPIIKFLSLYGLAFRGAQRAFNRPVRQQLSVRSRAGTAWYRYVGYRNSMPQVEGAGRTQFLNLASDINNRWTGSDLLGRGRQGLYLSADFLNQGEPFPELSHYQRGGQDAGDLIPYFEYHPGGDAPIDPQMRVARGTNLRSMFHFTLTRDLNGLDLRLRPEGNPLLDAVMEAMAQDPNFPAVERETRGTFDLRSLESMYRNPDAADFCRAVGNAALELPDVDHFLVTSARDGRSTNVIARTPVRGATDSPVRLDFLRPEGRATFFVTPDGRVGNGVFTISDMLYNASFESPTSPPPELPDVQVLRRTLIRAQQAAIDELSGRLTQELEIRPATNRMDALVDRIARVQEKLAGEDYGASMTAIEELKVAVTAAAQDPPTVGEFKASLELSTGVANTLSTIADSVQAAQERIDGMDPEPPDAIDDPNPEALDPALPETVPGEH